MKLLHLIATPRGSKSRTLQIADAFLANEKARQPDLAIDTLNLFEVELPRINLEVVDAKYTLMSGGSLSESGKLAYAEMIRYSQEFLNYDYYLVSSPMWNFNIPYQLKHYIDIIMQAGILFRFTANGVEGLMKNKKMVCITTRGGDYRPGTYINRYDFQEPYLRSIFGMAGITDISFINAQPLDISPEMTAEMIEKATKEINALALEEALA